MATTISPKIKLDLLYERLKQIEERVGQGFAPMLDPLNKASDKTLALITRFDTVRTQGRRDRDEITDTSFLDGILSWTGGFLALAAALGLLKPLFGLLRSGIMLIITPLGWLARGFAVVASAVAAFVGLPVEAVVAIAVAIGAAAYAIYDQWEAVKQWFSDLWRAIKEYYQGFYEFVVGVFTGNMARAAVGLWMVWDAIQTFSG